MVGMCRKCGGGSLPVTAICCPISNGIEFDADFTYTMAIDIPYVRKRVGLAYIATEIYDVGELVSHRKGTKD